MAMAEGQKEGVKCNVISCLERVLGADQQARKMAEEELKTLEVTEDYGVVLAEVTASADSPVQYRQLASILLKQYIASHWSSLSERFEEPELPDESKFLIKKLLPYCLGDSHSKVRAAVAYTISAIAEWEWPQHWPELFDQLTHFLESGDATLVHGTMRVLTEFCQGVSDAQLSPVANAILPHLLEVIVQAQNFSVQTRTRAVHVYNILSGLIFSLSLSCPEVAELVLFPSLEKYINTFVNILKSDSKDHGLRKEVIMTLCHLLRSFPVPLSGHIMMVVTPIWNILTHQTTQYLNSVVNSDSLLDEACDSDGEVIGQESSIFAVLEFISVLGENESLQGLLLPIFPQLLCLLIVFMEITQEQVSRWMENVNQFVDEDENELSYSVRLSALDLVQSFTEEEALASSCYSAIIAAMNKHLEETPPNSSLHWWKVHEACLMVCGVLVEGVKVQEVEFDLSSFVQHILLPDISAHASTLLTGRCLWLAGKMASLLPPSLLVQLMEVVAKALQPEEEPVLRVLAAKAVYYFCNELKGTDASQLMKTWLPSYLRCLCELASQSSEDVVFLVVDSLQLLTRMDMLVTAQHSSNIVPLAVSLFLHYSHDPGISSCVEELFEALSVNPGIHTSLHSHLIPLSVEILSGTSQSLGLVAVLLDVLVHVIRGCVVQMSSGIPSPFIQQVFPNAVKRVVSSSDSAVLQNGGECVRAFVSVAVEQLAAWKDPNGRSGLQYVLELVLHLLDPLLPEFSASYVGKLVIVLIQKAGSALGQDLQLLLRAILSKMQNVTTSSVMQSLLLVFAKLMHTELEVIISFLSHVPDPQGKAALHYVMVEWCKRHPFFFGVYENKISTLSLCQLLSYCISTGDQRMTEILVSGAKEDTACSHQVHLPVKILKLLIQELQQHTQQTDPLEGEEEEGLDGTLERLLAGAACVEQQWETEDDPDVLADPIMQLDIQAHVRTYLQELTQQPGFLSLCNYLSPSEQQTINQISQQ